MGSLELFAAATKVELGDMILDLLPKRKMEAVRPAMVWAIGRLGARVLMYGPLNTVVPAETAADWIGRLTAKTTGESMLAVMQLARRTDDRYRDVPEKLRRDVLAWLGSAGVARPLRRVGPRRRLAGHRRTGAGVRRIAAERIADFMMHWDVAIIGGGPAGLMAAARAAERGCKTILLDKNREPGVKILLSGGTHCNLTHATDARGIVEAFGPGGRFLHSALAALGPQEVVDLFEAEGVPTKVEPDGKVFPASDRASDVRDASRAPGKT